MPPNAIDTVDNLLAITNILSNALGRRDISFFQVGWVFTVQGWCLEIGVERDALTALGPTTLLPLEDLLEDYGDGAHHQFTARLRGLWE